MLTIHARVPIVHRTSNNSRSAPFPRCIGLLSATANCATPLLHHPRGDGDPRLHLQTPLGFCHGRFARLLLYVVYLGRCRSGSSGQVSRFPSCVWSSLPAPTTIEHIRGLTLCRYPYMILMMPKACRVATHRTRRPNAARFTLRIMLCHSARVIHSSTDHDSDTTVLAAMNATTKRACAHTIALP